MSNSNGKITAPIDIKNDVYRVLGLGARKITSTGMICFPLSYAIQNQHGKLNYRSLKKPVDQPLGYNRASEWWKGTSKDCNLNFSFDSFGEVETVSFRPPEINQLGMFDGYNQNAIEGLAFKNSVITHNLLSDSSVDIPFEDAADSVTLYDVKDCDKFKNLVPGIGYQLSGGDISISGQVITNWSNRSIKTTISEYRLDEMGVGDFVVDCVLFRQSGSSYLSVYRPFPNSLAKRCTLKVIANVGLTWYMNPSTTKVYDPAKYGYYPLSNYGRFSTSLNLTSATIGTGLIFESTSIGQSGSGGVSGPFSSSNIYMIFEWENTVSDGRHVYRCKTPLKKYNASTQLFETFSFTGGQVSAQYGCDYREMPKIDHVVQFYLAYKRIKNNTERFYRFTDKTWLSLNCSHGGGTIEDLGVN